ncbi:MAG: AAA family ATPase [Spartobacteria bacterium]
MAFSRDNALDLLRRARDNHRLGHAYLISGPPGSGKRSLAAEVTQLVNGTAVADVFGTAAREIFVAEPESKSRRIVVEQVRNLEHSLQMRAPSGRRKVAIIVEADRLQPQAANAFLKTLEEPPANSLLLLLTALPEILPDTILSRCISIPLAPTGEETPARARELNAMLDGMAAEKTWSVEHAYRLAQGLQSLLAGIRDEVRSANADALKREEAHYRNSTDGSWLEEREDYYKALSESLYLQRRALVIESLFAWWSEVLRAKTGVDRRDLPASKDKIDKVAARFSVAEVLRRIRRLEEMRDHLGRNIQEALAIEVAFLRVFGS